MKTTDFITEDIAKCILCEHETIDYQKNVHDPDHRIMGGWNYKICSNKSCSLVMLSPRPREDELIKAYSNYHTHSKSRNGFIRKYSLSFTKRIMGIISLPYEMVLGVKRQASQMKYMGLMNEKPGSLLELGVGGGRFLYRMKKRDWDVTGHDIDSRVAEKIYQKYKIKIYTGNFMQLEVNRKFDVIAMNQTVEHLINPLSVLQKCFELLKPGGRIVITTPNIESLGKKIFKEFWRGWEPPRHLYLYSPTTLEALIARAGFQVRKIETYACESQIGYYESFLNESFHRNRKLSLFHLVSRTTWSYWMELKEAIQIRKSTIAGQGIYIEGIK